MQNRETWAIGKKGEGHCETLGKNIQRHTAENTHKVKLGTVQTTKLKRVFPWQMRN